MQYVDRGVRFFILFLKWAPGLTALFLGPIAYGYQLDGRAMEAQGIQENQWSQQDKNLDKRLS